MLHEFAINPRAMTNFDRVSRFIEACGPGSPRLIANFPHGGWLKLAITSCAAAGLNVASLKKIEIVIETAIKRGRFMSRGRPYDDTATWIDCAIKEHGRLPFRAIVSGSDLNPQAGCLSVDADLSENKSWNPPRSATVERSTAELVGAIAPMLHLARRVILIEPYFDIGDRSFTDPIRAMLLAASSKPPRLEEVHLHIANRFDGLRAYLERDRLADLERLVPDGVTGRVFIWQKEIIPTDPNAKDKLHDRFLLTDRGGVQIGWGFKTERGSKTTISLLDDGTCQSLEKDVASDSRRFRAECSAPIEVSGRAR